MKTCARWRVSWVKTTREIDGWLAHTRQFLMRAFGMTRAVSISITMCARSADSGQRLRERSRPFLPGWPHASKPRVWSRNISIIRSSTRRALRSNYRLPSVAKNERGYSARRYWCGPVWIQINWIIAEGLRRYGFHRASGYAGARFAVADGARSVFANTMIHAMEPDAAPPSLLGQPHLQLKWAVQKEEVSDRKGERYRK